ncbi:MAG: PA0069 family radical SAM protein [Phycisphaerales bacterium]|nr:PA0069 family radical SAM protein [Phycisphaerales bacterium]
MLRRVDNPPNPYDRYSVDLLGEPPAARVEIYEERAHSIISENDSPDVPFRYSVNPYRGCQHACAYCYARPTHEYLGYGAGTDFETRLVVKINAAELLRWAITRRSWTGEHLAFSGVTDCYQPHEAVYGVTRACIQACAEHRQPISIVTKSYLITRDIDVLTLLVRDDRVRVFISIPFADDAMARAIESGAPSPTRRFDALRQLAAAGIPTGVMVAPIIPGLSDRQVAAVLEQAAACGAQWAGYMPLRLPGPVADVFLTRLRAVMPHAAGRVEALVRDTHGGRLNDPRFGCRFEGGGAYWEAIAQLFEKTATRLGLTGKPDWDACEQGITPRSPSKDAVAAPPRAELSVRQLPLWTD